jgi:intein/homing endonuclease
VGDEWISLCDIQPLNNVILSNNKLFKKWQGNGSIKTRIARIMGNEFHDSDVCTTDIESSSSSFQKSFLGGVFNMDGKYIDCDITQIRIMMNTKKLEIIQRMLLRFGVKATIDYERGEDYLVIRGFKYIRRFVNKIYGIHFDEYEEKLYDFSAQRYNRVLSMDISNFGDYRYEEDSDDGNENNGVVDEFVLNVSYCGENDVYSIITESGEYDANGIRMKSNGEFVPDMNVIDSVVFGNSDHTYSDYSGLSDYSCRSRSRSRTYSSDTSCDGGHCLKKSTIICTNKGLWSLGEIRSESEVILDEKIDQRITEHNLILPSNISPNSSYRFFSAGTTDTKKLFMLKGMCIEGTLDHKIMIIRDNELISIEIVDVVEGDIIPYRLGAYADCSPVDYIPLKQIGLEQKLSITPPRQPEILNPDMAWFIGLFYGAGIVETRGIRIGTLIKNYESLYKAKNIILKYFGITVEVYHHNSSFKNALVNLHLPSFIANWFRENDLELNKKNLRIPKKIRSSPINVIKAFIDGFWCGCGDYDLHKNKMWCLNGRKISEQLVNCLRFTGTDCKMYEIHRNEIKTDVDKKYLIIIDNDEIPEDIKVKLKLAGCHKMMYDIVQTIEYSTNETFDLEVDGDGIFLIQGGYLSVGNFPLDFNKWTQKNNMYQNTTSLY